MANKSKKDSVVRCFEVSEPTLHEKGFTIYKVSQKLIEVDAPEKDVTEIIVWRRFNDFKKLHQVMLKLHLALHRKDEFPPFSRPKVFGRFAEDVIIDRMRSAQDLLNFIGQRHYMVNSPHFKTFFEGGEAVPYEPHETVLKPQRLHALDAIESDNDSTTSSVETGSPQRQRNEQDSATVEARLELGGVWQFRQTGDDISLNGDEEEEESVSDKPITSSSKPVSTKLQAFDPLDSQEPSCSNTESANGAVSNFSLLSNEMTSVRVEDDILTITQDGSDNPKVKFQVGEASTSKPACGKGDLVESPIGLEVPDPYAVLSPGSPSKLHKNPSLLNLDVSDKGDYIIQAAKQISLAQHCEASGSYHLAFNYYKNGVGILLTGVQLDENETRIQVVRRKTARYLMKAEDIHRKYLADNDGGNNRWDTGQLSPAKELVPAVALLQGNVVELKNYKVLGIINTVLLVMDATTENTFVMKVLHKSCSDVVSLRRCLIAHRSPYMVELYRFYDTSSAIYLLLQHASGGRLWSYASHFLQQTAEETVQHLTDVFDNPHEKRLRSASKSQSDSVVHMSSNPAYKSSSSQLVPDSNSHDIQTDNNFIESVIDNSDSDNLTNKNTSNNLDCEGGKNNSQEYEINDEMKISLHEDTISDDSVLKEDDVLEIVSHSNTLDNINDNLSLGEFNDSLFSPVAKSDVNIGDANPLSPDLKTNAFQNLLETTRTQPLAGFSVDSFDSSSDNEPMSRQVSTTDPIESIAEEDIEDSSAEKAPNDVFIDSSSLNIDTSKDHKGAISKVGRTIEHSNYMDIKHSTPSKSEYVSVSDISTTDERTREQSIYDCYKDCASSSSTSDGDNLCINANNESIHSIDNDSTLNEENNAATNVSQHETKEESPVTRRRTLSSVFGDLDLADQDEQMTVRRRLPETSVRQWVAEIIVAVTALHKVGIICRDLKPSNILLGERGHILLTHFSQWSSVDVTLDEHAVDALYVAPEVIDGADATAACDWWSIGALLFELLTGQSLVSCHPNVTSHTQLYLPEHLSPEASSILQELLRFSPNERLGSSPRGVEDVKIHPFFAQIDWDNISKTNN